MTAKKWGNSEIMQSSNLDCFENENYGHKRRTVDNYGEIDYCGNFKIGDNIIYEPSWSKALQTQLGKIIDIEIEKTIYRGCVDNRGEHSEIHSQRITAELEDGKVVKNIPYLDCYAANTINLEKFGM